MNKIEEEVVIKFVVRVKIPQRKKIQNQNNQNKNQS